MYLMGGNTEAQRGLVTFLMSLGQLEVVLRAESKATLHLDFSVDAD